jgi:hypothetical protein
VVAAAARAWFADAGPGVAGITLVVDGQAEGERAGYAALAAAGVAALAGVYVLLVWLFRSFVLPLLVLATALFGLCGVVLTLGATALSALLLPEGWVRPERALITAGTIVAAIGLCGLVVNEAIVLVDAINRRRAEGADRDTAIRGGVDERLRSVLMTSLTTVAGLLPLACGLPRFHPLWTPFSACFLGGVLFGTLVTLVLVPAAYRLAVPAGSAAAETTPEASAAPEPQPASEPVTDGYLLLHPDGVRGPFDLAALRTLAANGSLRPEDAVRHLATRTVFPAKRLGLFPRLGAQPAPAPADRYFVELATGEEVAFTLAELRELHAAGELTPDRRVRSGAMAEAVPLHRAAGIFPRDVEAEFAIVEPAPRPDRPSDPA